MASLLDTFRERRGTKKAKDPLQGTFEAYPHLLALKPRERYLFRSDYWYADDHVACVLGYFHDDAAVDNFPSFWGIGRIPTGMPDGVVTIVLQQVRRMGEGWIDDNSKRSEQVRRLTDNEEAASGGSSSMRRRNERMRLDLDELHGELADGASYLHVHDRLLVKAPDLETLEEALDKITRSYIDRFATLRVAPYVGEQRRELSTLFAKNEKKRGPGFYFTSTEYAGSHSLVTQGLNDPNGEYIGRMVGDVNNSANCFDVNGYRHHVVVADDGFNHTLGRAHTADVWGSKISQAALLDNNRVVHIVLDGANLDDLGPDLDAITFRVDMNSGDVNMFEMFGEHADELNIFSAHLQKLVLMAEQAYPVNDHERAIVRGELEKVLTRFYVDQGMWVLNARENRDRLRLVGLPHHEVPTLDVFTTYLDTEARSMENPNSPKNEARLNAYTLLSTVFTNLLNNNGDLFNTHTSSSIDGAVHGMRVIYDFGQLLRRGRGVAMAQLVNVIGFAVDSLRMGDVVIIHGAEDVDPGVREYISDQLRHMYRRGGRAVFLYNSIEKMIADREFNKLGRADYSVLGTMSDTTLEAYQSALNQVIAPDLQRLITSTVDTVAYLRRGVDNVVLSPQLSLGVDQTKAEALRARVESPSVSVVADAKAAAREQHAENVASASSGKDVAPTRKMVPRRALPQPTSDKGPGAGASLTKAGAPR